MSAELLILLTSVWAGAALTMAALMWWYADEQPYCGVPFAFVALCLLLWPVVVLIGGVMGLYGRLDAARYAAYQRRTLSRRRRPSVEGK